MKRRFLTRGSICLAAVLAVTFVLGGSNIDVTRALVTDKARGGLGMDTGLYGRSRSLESDR